MYLQAEVKWIKSESKLIEKQFVPCVKSKKR